MRIFLAGILLLGGCCVSGQTTLSGYLDFGSHNASDGLFIKTAGLVNYGFGKNSLKTGFQFNLVDQNERVISGFTLNAARQLLIKDFPFKVEGFFLWNGHSSLLRETNWGLWLDFEWPHFNMSLGSEFRSYAFTVEAVESYNFQKENRIRENWNLLYNFGYTMKPESSIWNAGISITNMDHFIISQETNPVIKVSGLYKMSEPLHFFLEGWYKSAGAFNLSVNYFGFIIRTGVKWIIG